MTHAVLVLDDSLTVRMDLAEAFESAGYTVVPCASITEARAEMARHSISVAVLDVVLPDGNGVDFMVELRERKDEAPVVLLLSSEAEIGDRIRGLRRGADEYVGKPYDRGYVIAKARDLLR